MSPAEIQDLTEKAGFEWESLGFRDRMCFAKLVDLTAAKEREACARSVESFPWFDGCRIPSNREFARVIRARGKKEGAC